jgi:ferredoxin
MTDSGNHTKGPETGDRITIDHDQLDRLLDGVRDMGYTIVGPTVGDGAIVYDEVRSTGDLPAGWTDVQDGGSYRLERRSDDRLFGYAVGPHSWKKYLFPPITRLWTGRKGDGGFQVTAEADPPRKLALLGVRSCELHAIAIQDRVFVEGSYVDPVYAGQRANLLIIAVNCGHPAGTCFCVSMGTGPGVKAGFDIALTEVLTDGHHVFVVEVGSVLGAEALSTTSYRPASEADLLAAREVVDGAAEHMGRTMETEGIKSLLYRNYEHPRWDDVAARCLSCGNCTMVCPTCFCSTVDDLTDLTGEETERVRRWDSCFTMDHSYIHGGSVRPTTRSRYRQWMTHKLATWIDQFDTSGCVGCGRCITWCPVAIDITEEVAAIRATDEGSRLREESTDGNA